MGVGLGNSIGKGSHVLAGPGPNPTIPILRFRFGIRVFKVLSWESKGTPPMPPPPGNKALLRDY